MRTWEGCEHAEKCREVFKLWTHFQIKWMGKLIICKKLTSVDLNKSSVEVRVVDSNHDSCIEFFTILLIPLSTA